MTNNYIFWNGALLRFSVWLFALASLFFCPSQHTLHGCLSRRFLVARHILIFQSLKFVICILYSTMHRQSLMQEYASPQQNVLIDTHEGYVSSINTQNSALYWFMNNWLRLADIKHTDFVTYRLNRPWKEVGI